MQILQREIYIYIYIIGKNVFPYTHMKKKNYKIGTQVYKI